MDSWDILCTAAENIPYAIKRYRDEMDRLYTVVENSLNEEGYIAGDYSIADISLFPWMRKPSFYETSFYPKVEKWIDRIAESARSAKSYVCKVY